MCEFVDVIGESGIAYCTIPAADRGGPECKACKVNFNINEALADKIGNLQNRIHFLENKNKKKKEIEIAIKDINGLLLDFGEAVDSLRNTKKLLYSLIEKDNNDE